MPQRTSSDQPRKEHYWSSPASRDQYKDTVVADLDRTADLARTGNWDALLELLEAPREFGRVDLVNTPRVASTSGFTSLHQAAWHGAGREVVGRLLALGAWRTLRAEDGRRAIDVARSRGHGHLDELLEPPAPDDIRGPADLRDIESYLQTLVVIRARSFGVDGPLRLPQAGPIWEIESGASMWCSIPGMYGGFKLYRDGAELVSESWCRIVDGSGQKHRITPDGVLLESDGFA